MAKPDKRLLDPARFPFHTAVSPRYGDLDPNAHVNNLALATCIEDGRVRMYGQMMRANGAQLLMACLTVDYLAEAGHIGWIDVYSGIASIGRSSWVAEQMAMQNGIVVAYSTATMVERCEGRTGMTDEWRTKLTNALTRPVNPAEAG